MPAGPLADLLLVTGGTNHDFSAGAGVLEAHLAATGCYRLAGAQVVGEHVNEFAALPRSGFRAVLAWLHSQGTLTPHEEAGLVEFVRGGGGLVAMHACANSFTGNPGWLDVSGARLHLPNPTGGTNFDFPVRFTPAARRADHPAHLIVDGANDYTICDEFYVLDPLADLSVFASSQLDGRDTIVGYVRTFGRGRVVYITHGHTVAAISNPHVLRMVERGLRLVSGLT